MKKTFLILSIPFFISFCLSALIKVKSPDKYALHLEDIDLNKYLIIDARSLEEYKTAHINGAFHGNELEQVKSHIKQHPRNKPIILIYCNERCSYSKYFSQELRNALNYEHVFYLKGGFQSWQKPKVSVGTP